MAFRIVFLSDELTQQREYYSSTSPRKGLTGWDNGIFVSSNWLASNYTLKEDSLTGDSEGKLDCIFSGSLLRLKPTLRAEGRVIESKLRSFRRVLVIN